MNKKGFSLTELLVVIAVLALLAGLAFMAFDGIRDNVLNKQYENILEYARTGAEEYAMKYETQGISYVTIGQLIEDGIILADDEDGYIKNPLNGKIMNCIAFKIDNESNSYKVSVVDKTKEYALNDFKETCVNQITNSDFYIYCKPSKYSSYSFGVCKPGWYNTNVELSVFNRVGIKPSDYAKTVWFNAAGLLKENSQDLSVSVDDGDALNQTFFANINNKTVAQRIKIDKKAPTIIYTVDDSDENNQLKSYEKTIDISKSFDNESGIVGAYIEDGDKNCLIKNKINNTKKIMDPGIYTLCVNDAAGNITKKTLAAPKSWFFDPIPMPVITASDNILSGEMHRLDRDFTLSFKVEGYNASEIFYKYSLIDNFNDYQSYDYKKEFTASDMKNKTIIGANADYTAKESITIKKDNNNFNDIYLVQACNVEYENHCSKVASYTVNPDKKKPAIISVKYDRSSWSKSKTVEVTIEDQDDNNLNRVSGLSRYGFELGENVMYSYSKLKPIPNSNNQIINSYTFTFTVDKANKEGKMPIVIWAQDNAGNSIEDRSHVVDMIDLYPPDIVGYSSDYHFECYDHYFNFWSSANFQDRQSGVFSTSIGMTRYNNLPRWDSTEDYGALTTSSYQGLYHYWSQAMDSSGTYKSNGEYNFNGYYTTAYAMNFSCKSGSYNRSPIPTTKIENQKGAPTCASLGYNGGGYCVVTGKDGATNEDIFLCNCCGKDSSGNQRYYRTQVENTEGKSGIKEFDLNQIDALVNANPTPKTIQFDGDWITYNVKNIKTTGSGSNKTHTITLEAYGIDYVGTLRTSSSGQKTYELPVWENCNKNSSLPCKLTVTVPTSGFKTLRMTGGRSWGPVGFGEITGWYSGSYNWCRAYNGYIYCRQEGVCV